MADLIVVVFWHAHALDIPFPIGYRKEHLGESFFADTKTIIPDKASTDT